MRLLELCRQYDHPEVDRVRHGMKQLVRDREIELQHTFGKACEFQQEFIEILD